MKSLGPQAYTQNQQNPFAKIISSALMVTFLSSSVACTKFQKPTHPSSSAEDASYSINQSNNIPESVARIDWSECDKSSQCRLGKKHLKKLANTASDEEIKTTLSEIQRISDKDLFGREVRSEFLFTGLIQSNRSDLLSQIVLDSDRKSLNSAVRVAVTEDKQELANSFLTRGANINSAVEGSLPAKAGQYSKKRKDQIINFLHRGGDISRAIFFTMHSDPEFSQELIKLCHDRVFEGCKIDFNFLARSTVFMEAADQKELDLFYLFVETESLQEAYYLAKLTKNTSLPNKIFKNLSDPSLTSPNNSLAAIIAIKLNREADLFALIKAGANKDFLIKYAIKHNKNALAEKIRILASPTRDTATQTQ